EPDSSLPVDFPLVPHIGTGTCPLKFPRGGTHEPESVWHRYGGAVAALEMFSMRGECKDEKDKRNNYSDHYCRKGGRPRISFWNSFSPRTYSRRMWIPRAFSGSSVRPASP